MGLQLAGSGIQAQVQTFLQEDDLGRQISSLTSLPEEPVQVFLNIKSDLCLVGSPWFKEVFQTLGAKDFNPQKLLQEEGRWQKKGCQLDLGHLPFAHALTGERVALNLLQRASSIATQTHQLVQKARPFGIALLDTRKTTPGLRNLEKYAVYQGGGHNHRLGPTDAWMVKDNHKAFFGGLTQAVEFFRRQRGFYTPLIVEVHSLRELHEAYSLEIKHVLLDNFSPQEVREAVQNRPPDSQITFEVSGGIKAHNIEDYLIEGIQAISLGALTYAPPPVDLSLLIQRPLGTSPC